MLFVCVNLRDLRETSGFSFEQYRLSTLACYSPADYADYAEECSKLHYPAEKYRLFGVVAVIAVLWFVCVNQRETFGVSSGYID